MATITTIEGIGPVLAEKFASAGVKSVEALLEHGATKSGRSKLAEDTRIDEKRILKFVNAADLMRINGIGGEYAELLEAAGVDTVKELARRNPENLHQTITAVNEENELVRSVAPLSRVENWIEQAKALAPVVTH